MGVNAFCIQAQNNVSEHTSSGRHPSSEKESPAAGWIQRSSADWTVTFDQNVDCESSEETKVKCARLVCFHIESDGDQYDEALEKHANHCFNNNIPPKYRVL